ncbi:MAG TPA: bifunctional diguanylate cyclase/phosphodiesterase [Steroidobacteraceae bacterium]|nr:bifunctional diguanylate cyclase/phosphodiesterase [Steroidobacteraceae bacterium]
MLLLAGTATYLVVQARERIRTDARQSALNIAVGLERSATALLAQSTASLRGIQADLSASQAEGAASLLPLLQEAMRFDPLSELLGVRGSRTGEIAVVDRAGHAGSLRLRTALSRALCEAESGTIRLCPAVQLPGDETWYVPLTLGARRADAVDAVFALVPARSLVVAAQSLQLIPGSWLNFVTADGTRLFRYVPSRDAVEIPEGRTPPEVLDLAAAHPSGILELSQLPASVQARTLPGIYLDGYSRSALLPLYVTTTVPVSSLITAWLQQSIGPGVIFLTGMLAVVIFGWQLRAALLRQRRYSARQEYLASHDTLTGLLNRDAFMRLLAQNIADRPRESFAVILLDLNRFKDINDTLGHAVGDRVLAQVGKRLSDFINDEGFVARLGGDELVIFTPGAHVSDAVETLCGRMQACLGKTILTDGVELDLTASMGAALYPQDAQTPTELLRCADIAMYAAKGDLTPYSRYSKMADSFTPEMLALKSEFAKALREGGLRVVYQPKVRLSDGALAGLEALSRWTHPVIGPVSPAKYIHLVESTELIHPLTQFVLKSAVEQIARWREMGHNVPVAVNISANNLLDHTFVEKLGETLQAAAVPAHLLELEITESAVMRHPETILRRLHAIRELGVQLSIDDFGTGYASLSYLKRLPVSTLKIDRSFVVNLNSDEADQRIVRSSIQLAHGFGMTVVAEGVESEAAAELLRQYGCDQAQGFLFARPQAAQDLEKNLTRSWPTPAVELSSTAVLRVLRMR